MSDNSPPVTVLILNWNGRSILPDCLQSLMAVTYPACRLVLADNGSTDDSIAYVREAFPSVNIIELGQNLGFSRGVNQAIRQLSHEDDILVLLNNDVSVRPEWLHHLVAPFADPAVGITGCKLLYPDARHIQHAGAELLYPTAVSHHFYYQEVDKGQADLQRDVSFVTGAALAVRYDLVDDSGLFDEAFAPFYYEEADLCYRMRASGYRVIYVPDAVAIHHESYSTGKRNDYLGSAFHVNRFRFVLKHYTVEQFLNDFVPAELERLRATRASDEYLDAVRSAYLEMMLSLPKYAGHWFKVDEMGSIWVSLDRLWRASLTVEPYRVPGFAFGKPLLEPAVKTLLDIWNTLAAKILLWPVIRQQHMMNALLSRMLLDKSQTAIVDSHYDEVLAGEILELRQQIQALAQSYDALERRLDER
jgi:GT2 family glycosyltransferase